MAHNLPIPVTTAFITAALHLYPERDRPQTPDDERIAFGDHGDGKGPQLLKWPDSLPIPTEAEIVAAAYASDLALAQKQRRFAYQRVADGMAIRAQRLEWLGDPDAAQAKADYLAKIAEIKAEFPDPEAP